MKAVIVVLIVLVLGVAAVLYFTSKPSQPTTSLTPTTSPTKTITPTTPTTETVKATVDIEGYWHGEYSSKLTDSKGEFCFKLEKVSEEKYVGALVITDEAGRYEGSNIPLTVRVSGDTIEIGMGSCRSNFYREDLRELYEWRVENCKQRKSI